MFITTAFINEHSVQILIDDGAELNHLSEDFCRRHFIATKEEDHEACMANKASQKLKSTLEPLQLSIHGYSERLRFVVCPLNYDLILGKKWTTAHEAVLNCYTNEVKFTHRNKCHTIVATKPKSKQVVSVNAITRDLSKKHQLYAVMLREVPSTDQRSTNNHEDKDIETILNEYKDVFPGKLPKGLPPKRSQDFVIDLKEGSMPQKKGLYRMSTAELKELKAQLQDLIEHEFIRPSSSPWGAPVLFASKKDGGLRLCIDYRALNRLTQKNSYPLPRIDDILDQLSTAKYFTTIDLRSGYHQIRLDPKSIPMTAFRTRYGHFEFRVVPFGLTNAPAKFMELMNESFTKYLDKFVIVYLDDILVYSESWEDHLRHLRKTLDILRKEKLYAKRSKCFFGAQEVEYLGFILKPNGVAMNPHKTRAITEWPTPESKKDIQSFLGLVNYYRRFIKNCSGISKPLTELTKNVPFIWTTPAEESFEKLKSVITSAPVLRTFRDDLPVFVTTDASKVAIGAVLEQDDSDGRRPVAFTSRTLNSAEQNYAAHDLELLGIVDTLRAWRCYLHGRKFVVHTDHYPLRYIETQDQLSQRQVRWLERIVEFDFTIIPVKGKSNNVADALSRQGKNIPSTAEYAKELLNKVINKVTRTNAISIIHPGPSIVKQLELEYTQDPEFSAHYKAPENPYKVQDKMLFREDKLCIPKGKFRTDLLHDHHASPNTGHLGEVKTRHRVKPHYYWKDLRKDIHDYVKSCRICQQTKARNHRPYGLLQPIDPPDTKWTTITMDFITPLPQTKQGHNGILNVVDKLSKMIRSIPIPKNSDAVTIAKLFKEHIYRNHGLPSKIISDRDTIFMSKFWKTLFKLLGTKIAPSTAYHPQTDGQSEIANRKTEEMIRAFANFRKDNWDEHLVDFEVAYNSAINSTTLYSPFYLNYGIHPKTIPMHTLSSNNPSVAEFLKSVQESSAFARENIRKRNIKMAEYANKSRIPHQFAVNDKVWLSTKNLSLSDGFGSKKLHPKFCGPFTITKKINDVAFTLDLSEPMKQKGIHNTFHVSLLKPYVEDRFNREPVPPPAIALDDGTQEFEVEKILAHRRRRNKQEYLVKWKGYPDHENTWQTINDLQNAKQAIVDFNASSRCSS